MAIEPIHVVDTQALIWYLRDDQRLSARARAVFAAAERGETRLHVSAISVAEFYYANQKFGWFRDFSVVYRELVRSPYFRFVPFTAADTLDFEQDAAVSEMHDRIIAGLARRLGAPLLTADPQIVAANIAMVIW